MEKMGDVSVVMACLNEARTVGTCVEKACHAFKRLNLQGEVIVVDNGSTDGSGEIARGKGARVILEERRGYGHAYRRGFQEARGHILVMADADGTYDFSDLREIIHPLTNGVDFVIGSRFKGEMLPGSMSWVKRQLGNQVATGLLNFLFQKNLSDSQSGFRAFRHTAFQDTPFHSKGMEFATEMIVRAFRKGLRIQEIPITYYPRRGGCSKFKTLQDSASVLYLLFSSYLQLQKNATRNGS